MNKKKPNNKQHYNASHHKIVWHKIIAKRYLEIWYSNTEVKYSTEKIPTNTNLKHKSPLKKDGQEIDLSNLTIDDALELGKFIEINYSHKKECKVVKPIKNSRNKFLMKIIKLYLIYFCKENSEHIKNLEKMAGERIY